MNVSVFDGYGNTALHYSAYFNRLKLMDFIFKCNEIDINQQNTSKATPLHLASEMKHIEAVRKLINANNNGYKLDINALNSNNWTALHFACFVNVASVNKQKNGNKNDDQKLDENELKEKINNMINIDLIQLLIQNGCDKSLKNSSNKTAFEVLPVQYLDSGKLQNLRSILT